MSIEAMKLALDALDRSDYLGWQANIPVMRTLRQAIAEAEQAEPVAWGAFYFGGKRNGKLYSYADNKDQIEAYIVDRHRSDDSNTFRAAPLYTRPPARKPLTDEEINTLWDAHVVPVFGKQGINPVVFARAIERAHGIGEV